MITASKITTYIVTDRQLLVVLDILALATMGVQFYDYYEMNFFERILIFSLLDYVQLRNHEVDEEDEVPQPFDEEGPTKRFVKSIHRISCIDFRILIKELVQKVLV